MNDCNADRQHKTIGSTTRVNDSDAAEMWRASRAVGLLKKAFYLKQLESLKSPSSTRMLEVGMNQLCSEF